MADRAKVMLGNAKGRLDLAVRVEGLQVDRQQRTPG